MLIQAKSNFSIPGMKPFREGQEYDILPSLAEELLHRGLACKVAKKPTKAATTRKKEDQKELN